MKTLPIVIATLALQLAAAHADEPSSQGAQLLSTGNTETPSSDAASTPPADTSPDATLKLKGGSFAVGIGYVWGHGSVDYQGAAHKFSIHGVSVADVGGSSISAEGVVMNLGKLSDFSGNYVAWSAGVTVGGGGSAVYMKNEHGVVIKLISQTAGLRFNLSGDGVKVRLQS
jgi:hypothetical protein